jgi:glycylpeptide N-tetradecanoyltransferase
VSTDDAQNPETHKITDFFSFSTLSSTVIRSTKYPIFEAACLFYYASETAFVEGSEADGLLRERLAALIGDAVVVAHTAGFDVLTAWTLMDNVLLFQDLKVCT